MSAGVVAEHRANADVALTEVSDRRSTKSKRDLLANAFGQLFVQLRDSNWLHDDHLSIWLNNSKSSERVDSSSARSI
jgi:hypothetical protein